MYNYSIYEPILGPSDNDPQYPSAAACCFVDTRAVCATAHGLATRPGRPSRSQPSCSPPDATAEGFYASTFW